MAPSSPQSVSRQFIAGHARARGQGEHRRAPSRHSRPERQQQLGGRYHPRLDLGRHPRVQANATRGECSGAMCRQRHPQRSSTASSLWADVDPAGHRDRLTARPSPAACRPVPLNVTIGALTIDDAVMVKKKKKKTNLTQRWVSPATWPSCPPLGRPAHQPVGDPRSRSSRPGS